MFEVDDQSDLRFRSLQIVEHLADFVVCDVLDGFCVDDDLVVNDQIWNVVACRDSFVGDRKGLLLLNGNASKAKFD